MLDHCVLYFSIVSAVCNLHRGAKYFHSRSDLPKFEYLTQCIKEGMRLHAPVAIVGRETTKELRIADLVIPPGVPVGVGNMLMPNLIFSLNAIDKTNWTAQIYCEKTYNETRMVNIFKCSNLVYRFQNGCFLIIVRC